MHLVFSDNKNCKSFTIYAVLMGLCAAAHVSVHLPEAGFSASWLLGVAVYVCAMWLIYQPTVMAFLVLAVVQIGNVVADAPYNPDHWLLIFFANLIALGAALKIWREDRVVSQQRLMETLISGTRLAFLICYAFAAFAKYNTDFLFSENSVAREMFQRQAGAMPMLSWLMWLPAVPWVTLACETSIPLLLLFSRTRHIAILVGIFFHMALIISPAVKVYDFTIVVYTMLYLFTPAGFESNLRDWWEGKLKQAPAFFNLLYKFRGIPLLVSAICLVTVSTQYPLLEIPPRLLWLRWMVAMVVLCCVVGLCFIGLFSGPRRSTAIAWFPKWGIPYAVITLAIANGLCPYVGLKTQGSFTMFSNLRTEAGKWNHLFMPEELRFVKHYQDRLVRIVASNDPVLNERFVEPGLLATEFEVRRRVMDEPSLSLTTERDGQKIVIDPAAEDEILGSPLDLLPRKLLIFRSVSPDGSPFITN